MSGYSPINQHKLNKEAKEFLKTCKSLAQFNVTKIHVSPVMFSYILDSISPASRSYYSDAIPFEDKILVRK